MKDVYLILRDRIESEVPEIKHVRLFNNQFERSNNDDTRQNIEQAFPYPCIFVDFPSIVWTEAQQGVQIGDVTITLRLGILSYEDEDLSGYDLKTAVHQALQGYKGNFFTPLVRVEERIDRDHNNVQIFEIDYKTTYQDNSGFKGRNKQSVFPWSPDVTGENVITNYDIRTGKFDG